MRKSKLSESQIVKMLNEAQAGVRVEDLCRQYKISNATYYKFKSRYSGINVSELKRLRELEKENERLKSMFAEVSLEQKILKEVLAKKFPEMDESD